MALTWFYSTGEQMRDGRFCGIVLHLVLAGPLVWVLWLVPSPGDGHLLPVLLHTWGLGWLFSSTLQLPSTEILITSISAVAAESLITHELGDGHCLLSWAWLCYWCVFVT